MAVSPAPIICPCCGADTCGKDFFNRKDAKIFFKRKDAKNAEIFFKRKDAKTQRTQRSFSNTKIKKTSAHPLRPLRLCDKNHFKHKRFFNRKDAKNAKDFFQTQRQKNLCASSAHPLRLCDKNHFKHKRFFNRKDAKNAKDFFKRKDKKTPAHPLRILCASSAPLR